MMEQALVDSVRRALTVQELRQAEYKKLKKAQGDYTSQEINAEDYQKAMTEVTASFQSLSKQMIELIKLLREHSLNEAASVLDKVQDKEKEKLQLTAQWQVLQVEQKGKEDEHSEGGDEVEDFGEAAHKEKKLRQKLAVVEGAIAELVQDFRYECEHLILSETQT